MANSQYLSRLSSDERKELIKKLWSAQNGKCFISGDAIDLDLHYHLLDIDHIVPTANNGKDDPSNFALTFQSANRSKQAADLNLARIIWKFKKLTDKLQHDENRNPNLTDVLLEYGGASQKLHFKIKEDSITYSFGEIGNTSLQTLPIFKDAMSEERYFFALLPIEYIFHDDKINPRSIGSNVTKLLAEFYKGNPQLHVSLGYIEENDDNACEIKLFDGQHKAAAQIMLGVRAIPVRVFVNPNKDKLIESNFNAGTTLKQVAFDKSIQRHLGNTLYLDHVERYQKQVGLSSDDYSFSEVRLVGYFKGESREMKRYIIDSVKDGITFNEDNRLQKYIDMGGRAKEKPLSYSTVEKTFYSFFISTDLLETNIDYKLEEGKNPRELEKSQIVRLMNIIADNILVGKYDFEIGTYKIENRIQNQESVDWDHVVAYRMMKEEVVYTWLHYILDIIGNYYLQLGKTVMGKTNWFQEDIPEQLWKNITAYIINLSNLPLWRNAELTSAVFGGKQNYKYWQTIFSTGLSPQGTQVLAEPINLNKMIVPIQ